MYSEWVNLVIVSACKGLYLRVVLSSLLPSSCGACSAASDPPCRPHAGLYAAVQTQPFPNGKRNPGSGSGQTHSSSQSPPQERCCVCFKNKTRHDYKKKHDSRSHVCMESRLHGTSILTQIGFSSVPSWATGLQSKRKPHTLTKMERTGLQGPHVMLNPLDSSSPWNTVEELPVQGNPIAGSQAVDGSHHGNQDLLINPLHGLLEGRFLEINLISV